MFLKGDNPSKISGAFTLFFVPWKDAMFFRASLVNSPLDPNPSDFYIMGLPCVVPK